MTDVQASVANTSGAAVSTVRLWSEGTEPLTTALQLPTLICIEATAGKEIPTTDAQMQPIPDMLFLSITTASAYHLPLTQFFLSALEKRIQISSGLKERIQIALHEGVTNAIVHGNLAITSENRVSLAGLASLETMVAERLARPTEASRRVRIHCSWKPSQIVLVIRDEGQGYTIKQRPPGQESAYHGRGLPILKLVSDTLSIEDGGRCLDLRFAR